MEFAAVTKKSDDYKTIKRLYKASFPSEERAPFRLLMNRAKKGLGEFWAAYDKGVFKGMTYVIRYKNLAYIFYLAIAEEARGKGYGTAVIEELKARYRDCRLFLALETLDAGAPNYEQRLKRHAFYERCGFVDLPCKIREASVVYAVMGMGGEVEREEYGQMMRRYLGGFMSKVVNTRVL